MSGLFADKRDGKFWIGASVCILALHVVQALMSVKRVEAFTDSPAKWPVFWAGLIIDVLIAIGMAVRMVPVACLSWGLMVMAIPGFCLLVLRHPTSVQVSELTLFALNLVLLSALLIRHLIVSLKRSRPPRVE